MPNKYATEEERKEARRQTKAKYFYKSELLKWKVTIPDDADYETLKAIYAKNCEEYKGQMEDTLHDALKVPKTEENKTPKIELRRFSFPIEDQNQHVVGVFKDGIAPLLYGVGGHDIDLNGKEIDTETKDKKKSSWKF